MVRTDSYCSPNVRVLRAQVVEDNCSECRNELLSDCRVLGFPMPVRRVILIPGEIPAESVSHAIRRPAAAGQPGNDREVRGGRPSVAARRRSQSSSSGMDIRQGERHHASSFANSSKCVSSWATSSPWILAHAKIKRSERGTVTPDARPRSASWFDRFQTSGEIS